MVLGGEGLIVVPLKMSSYFTSSEQFSDTKKYECHNIQPNLVHESLQNIQGSIVAQHSHGTWKLGTFSLAYSSLGSPHKYIQVGGPGLSLPPSKESSHKKADESLLCS
jgi:hypothetical protein